MKNSKTIGDAIRNALCGDWKITALCGRTIAVRKITSKDSHFRSCADCRADSHVIVVELNRFTPNGSKCDVPLVWGWCGHCDI